MAKQFGLVRYEGTIGDATFVRTPDGFIVKERTSLDKERLLTDDKFENTRKNMYEFGAAAKAAGLISRSVRSKIKYAADRRMINRLGTLTRKILKTDPVNPLGQRTVADGNLLMLQGFGFNKNALLSEVFQPPVAPSIDRVTGEFEVAIPSYVADNEISAPENATHYQFVLVGLEADFPNAEITTASALSAMLPVVAPATAPLTLTCTGTPNSTLPLVLGFGIAFYELVNGVYVPKKNGANNTIQLLTVDA